MKHQIHSVIRRLSCLAAALVLVAGTLTIAASRAEDYDLSTLTERYVASDNGKGVRLRSSMSADGVGNVLLNLGEAKSVYILGEYGAWTEIAVPYNGRVRTGYVMTSYLSTQDPSAESQSFRKVTPFEVKAVPAGEFCRLRQRASYSSGVLRKIDRGEILTVTAESRAWYKVEDAEGNTGFVVKATVCRQ